MTDVCSICSTDGANRRCAHCDNRVHFDCGKYCYQCGTLCHDCSEPCKECGKLACKECCEQYKGVCGDCIIDVQVCKKHGI